MQVPIQTKKHKQPEHMRHFPISWSVTDQMTGCRGMRKLDVTQLANLAAVTQHMSHQFVQAVRTGMDDERQPFPTGQELLEAEQCTEQAVDRLGKLTEVMRVTASTLFEFQDPLRRLPMEWVGRDLGVGPQIVRQRAVVRQHLLAEALCKS